MLIGRVSPRYAHPLPTVDGGCGSGENAFSVLDANTMFGSTYCFEMYCPQHIQHSCLERNPL